MVADTNPDARTWRTEMAAPNGWTDEQWARLHPGFAADLAPLLAEAERRGLVVRPRSLERSNARQRGLRQQYESARRLWDGTLEAHAKGLHHEVKQPLTCCICWAAGSKKGPEPRPPLPAAKAGASSHNYGLCPVEPVGHPHDCHDECPWCGAAWVPATVAVDVMLLDKREVAVPSGGAVSLARRPEPWGQWAALVHEFPALRDGGTFSTPDPVHVEWSRWDCAKAGLRPA